MKKNILIVTSLCVVVTMFGFYNANANEFADNEDYYMDLCSSDSLSSSQIDTCSDFNSYLQEKSDDYADLAAESAREADTAEVNLEEIADQIDTLEDEIADLEEEITYLNTSISNLEDGIEEKEALIKERMYAMQSYTNNDFFVQFIFGASDFVDMFSRVESVNELTEYDKELITGLQEDKATVETQRTQVEDAMDAVASQRETQLILQENYEIQYNEALTSLEEHTEASDEVEANQEIVEQAISASFSNLNSSSSSGGSLVPGDSSTGNAVAQKALTRLGCLYWWGAPGGGYGDGQGLDNPNAIYFDCSGLVAWAHRQSGVSISRTTAHGYSSMGTSVSYSNLQPGDVVTFNGGGSGRVFHIGIYIGGGNVVHASGYGSSSLGNKPSEYVRVDTLANLDRWLGVYNYRRLY